MTKTAVIINWVMLVLFGAAFLVLEVRYPRSMGIGGLILLAPYGAALLAFRSQSRALVGSGIFLNVALGLLVFCYMLIGLTVAPLKGFIVLPVLGALILNCVVLKAVWDRTGMVGQ